MDGAASSPASVAGEGGMNPAAFLFAFWLGDPAVTAPVTAAMGWAVSLVPLWVVNMAHSLYVCFSMYHVLKGSHWLASMVLSVGACVAGSTLRALLLGLRVDWLASDTAIPTYILAWFTVNHLGARRLFDFMPTNMAIIVLEMIHKSRTITGAVDAAVKALTHPVWVGPIIIGTLASCTGSFYRVLVERSMLGATVTLSELSKPTNAIKFGFFLSLFYFFTTDPYGVRGEAALTKEVALLFIIYYLITYGIIATIVGPYTPFPISVLEHLVPRSVYDSQYSPFTSDSTPSKSSSSSSTKPDKDKKKN